MEIIWRGWQGHFICNCRWHLNTLITLGNVEIILSTVGFHPDSLKKGEWASIGSALANGKTPLFESMAFETEEPDDQGWIDIDVGKQLSYFDRYETEQEAQTGHYKFLKEIKLDMITDNIKGKT